VLFIVLPTLMTMLGGAVGLWIVATSRGLPVSWSLIAFLLSGFWLKIVAVNLSIGIVGWCVVARPGGRRLRGWALMLFWPWRAIYRARHSAPLAEWLVARAVSFLPSRYREQYEAEWLGEVDWHKRQGHPLLGWAMGVAGTAVFTRLELRARLAGAAGRLRELPKSGPARAVRKAKPIWLGVVTGVSVFCAAAAGWSGVGQQGPTQAQLLWAISASVLAGSGVTWQAWPRGPVADEPTDADGRLDE
jgi:hypothetical protein